MPKNLAINRIHSLSNRVNAPVLVSFTLNEDISEILSKGKLLKNTDISSYGNTEINMMPIYLNSSYWDMDFSKLSDQLELANLRNILIVGDLNARIGYGNNIDDDMCALPASLMYTRKTKDIFADQKGKKLLNLLDNYNCLVLNGRGRGNSHGEMTFIGGMGSSVIDFACASIDILKLIDDFRVIPLIHSDHMPILIHFKFKIKTVN